MVVDVLVDAEKNRHFMETMETERLCEMSPWLDGGLIEKSKEG